MDSSGGPHDPWQWAQLALAGFLGAIGKRLWEVLRGTPRPDGGEHGASYLAEQIRLMRESQDRTEAQVENLVTRVTRLEQHRANAGD